ncbi:hypothetical protein ID858_07505 [Xenorhabdus sp. DI]|uniref:hypothetical protein n=1 Tax=Xenorhabdus doucetiae TaxID=351671 RepID=UPI0019B95315|nr:MULTISPECIES: hypothetical protein [unclassified Xenorhabdus]MBD2784551.1 hypothetical protein [Xenorhabdus sp. 3]MBD2788352.1 hypothetical protein [Xenorhabdus sp. DI]
MSDNIQETNINILAGNSRVYLDQEDKIVVEAQLKAFEAALILSKKIQDKCGQLPRISIAFDHRGIFRLQFLADNLSNSQKRNPRLSQLHTSIVNVFLPIAEKHQISLGEIRVIHEDSARQHLVHILASEEIPEILKQRMVSKSTSDSKPSMSDISYEEPTQKLTCAAITKEYFEKAAGDNKNTDTLLEVFFEDCVWSRALAYVRGLQLSHMLGVSSAIRLNLVSETGDVSQGDITIA